MVLKTLQTFEADYDLAPCCFWRVLFEGKKFQQEIPTRMHRGENSTILPEIGINRRYQIILDGVCFCFDLVLDYGRSAI